MASTKTIVLITGGNGGIGFELASQLLSDSSKHVLLGSRSATKGEAAVKDLQSRGLPGTVELLEIDLAKEQSIQAAAKTVESKHGRLDALVNNAGVALVPGTITQQMTLCYETNVIAPVLMVEAFAPLLKKATGTPRIINVSTDQGSITKRYDPSWFGYQVPGVPYRASKSALNMVTACQAFEYGKEGFKVFAYSPGFTVSKLSPHNNADHGAKPTSEGATPMVRILAGERDAELSHLLHLDSQVPW